MAEMVEEMVLNALPEQVKKTKVKRVKKVLAEGEVAVPRKINKWVVHLTDFRKKNPKLSLKEAMTEAKASYKKV